MEDTNNSTELEPNNKIQNIETKAYPKIPTSLPVRARSTNDLRSNTPTILNSSNNYISPKRLMKKPPTSFILYCQERRPQLKIDYPSLSMLNLSKLVAREWRELDEDTKKIYKNKSQKLFNDYKALYPDIPFKVQKKRPKCHVVQQNLAKIDSFSAVNSLFQSSPLIFQQLLVRKGSSKKEITIDDLYYPSKE